MVDTTQAAATAGGPTQHTQNQGALVPARTATGGSQALSLASMSPRDAFGFAQALSESSLLPRQYQKNPGSVLWALEFGRGLGLDVITTIQSVHIIQGKATMSADLMASLCRRAGHRMRVSGDETHAKVVIFRADDPEFPFEVTWSMDRARQAQLTGKDTWKQYPAAMLRARAISECVRMACPEVLHGAIYTPEERGAAIDEDGLPVDGSVSVTQVPASCPAAPQRPAPEPADNEADYSHPGGETRAAPLNTPANAGQAVQAVLDGLVGKAQGQWDDEPALANLLAQADERGVADMEVDGPNGQQPFRQILNDRITALAGQQQGAA
ncbi:recombinase RecT [Streptomyces sp. NPDC059740]|uniref:recombinase RecT n=1 Tax=Streptomyces sp. NPDC059740 TaxID=3346926 RepID=UPI00366421EB